MCLPITRAMEGVLAGPRTAADGNHFSCSMSAVLLARVHAFGGDQAVARLLALARYRALPRVPARHHQLDLLRRGDRPVAGRDRRSPTIPEFARAVGADAAERLNASPVAALLRSLGSPENVYRQIATTASKFSVAAQLEATDAVPGSPRSSPPPRPASSAAPHHCAWTRGLLSTTPMLFGLPRADVQHDECAAFGAEPHAATGSRGTRAGEGRPPTRPARWPRCASSSTRCASACTACSRPPQT